jgi:hypothetical protein
MRATLLALLLVAAPAFAQTGGGGVPPPPGGAGTAEHTVDAARAYTIESTPQLTLKKGQTGEAKVTVVPRSDAHVSPDAPISMTLTGGSAVELPKQKLGRADAKETAKKGVEFAIPVVAKTGGKDEVKGQLSFFICTEKLCERQKRDVSVPVTVE